MHTFFQLFQAPRKKRLVCTSPKIHLEKETSIHYQYYYYISRRKNCILILYSVAYGTQCYKMSLMNQSVHIHFSKKVFFWWVKRGTNAKNNKDGSYDGVFFSIMKSEKKELYLLNTRKNIMIYLCNKAWMNLKRSMLILYHFFYKLICVWVNM